MKAVQLFGLAAVFLILVVSDGSRVFAQKANGEQCSPVLVQGHPPSPGGTMIVLCNKNGVASTKVVRVPITAHDRFVRERMKAEAKKNAPAIVRLYRKEAESGNAIAMLELGASYSLGRVVQQDYSEALR